MITGRQYKQVASKAVRDQWLFTWTANQNCFGYHKHMDFHFWYKSEELFDTNMSICISKYTRHGICQDLVDAS